jgi:hypothetical protein
MFKHAVFLVIILTTVIAQPARADILEDYVREGTSLKR